MAWLALGFVIGFVCLSYGVGVLLGCVLLIGGNARRV